MDAKELSAKLNGILDAIAAGRSCEQILAADGNLSYRDIFHAVTEAPTTYWKKVRTGNRGKGSPCETSLARTPATQRAD
jgi:hypothetical protein